MRYRKRYQLVFGALLSVVGLSARKEFGKEEDLVKMLAAIAEKVKAAKEKEVSDPQFKRAMKYKLVNRNMETTGLAKP